MLVIFLSSGWPSLVKQDYNAAFGRAAAGVKEAQKYIKIDEERSFNQTQLPKHERSMQPIPEGRMDTSYVPPSGDVLDPFNFACSEDTSRINPQHPLFAEHMSANMRQPFDMPTLPLGLKSCPLRRWLGNVKVRPEVDLKELLGGVGAARTGRKSLHTHRMD